MDPGKYWLKIGIEMLNRAKNSFRAAQHYRPDNKADDLADDLEILERKAVEMLGRRP